MISLMVQTILFFGWFEVNPVFFPGSVFVFLAPTQVSNDSPLQSKFHLFKRGNLIKVYIYTRVASHNSCPYFLPSSARQTAVTPPLAS